MPVSLPFTIVFQGHCGTLNFPSLVGSPYGGIVFLSSLSIIGIPLAFVHLYQICFLSSIPAASSSYSFTLQFSKRVPYYIIRECVFTSESIYNSMPP
jgi:hypothetical protein